MAQPSPADIPMTCPACHQPLTPGVKFCESCGAKLAPAPVCPHCGDMLTPGVKFCESCGRPVGSQPAPPVPPAPQAPVPDLVGPEGNQEKPEIPEAPPVPVVPEKPAPKKGTKKAKEGGKKAEKKLPAPDKRAGEPAPVPAAGRPAEAPAQPVPEPPAEQVPETPAAAPRPEEQAPPVSEKPPERPGASPVVQAVQAPVSPAPASRAGMLAVAGIAGLLVIAAVVWFVVFPMLSGPPGGGNGLTLPGVSPQPTAAPSVTGTQAAPAVSFEPLPTQRLPVSLEVVYQAERDPRNGMVTVTFRGGPGMNGIAETLVRVTKSDGQVVTKTFKPRQIGDSVSVQGTMQRDRVEVISNFYNGESYRCIDTVFEYKQRN